MTGLDEMRERMADFLREGGLEAVTAWPEAAYRRVSGTVAAVSLKSVEGGPSGFQDYLGERYNKEAGRWEELYGKRVRLVLGLDLYASRGSGEAGIRRAFDGIAERLRHAGPAGLRVAELSAGETGYDQVLDLYHARAEAVCEAYLYAVADEGGTFLDFKIRGERIE